MFVKAGEGERSILSALSRTEHHERGDWNAACSRCSRSSAAS
jgi:hypothetical protein